MTVARVDNVARDLLARLVDEADLEFAPLEELRANLTLLDIDAARLIRFSRRLAEEASSPAGGLLARTLAVEESDSDIAALESADLNTVRAELSAASPLAAARAQRLANETTAVVAPRHRSSRLLWYGIGGAITAIAASVLIVVGLSSSDVGPRQMAFAPDNAPAPAMRSQEEQATASATTTAKSAPSSSVPESSAETASRDTPVFSGGHKGETTEKTAAEKERLKKQAIDALISSGVTNLGGYPFSPRPIEAGELADLNVTAALILQPELVPEPLRQSDLGEGGLMLRLPEVARLPTQKYIVALVTLEQADGTMMDGMLLHLPIGNLRYLQKSEVVISNQDAEASALTEPVAAPLTLRQLLGNEADQFRLIEMQPTAAAGQE